MKRSEKQLPSKANFGHFFKLNCLGLNSVKGLRVTKIVKETRFEGVWGRVRIKKFPETIIYKIFETNSSFHLK